MKAIKRTVAALLATLMLATSTSFTLAAEEYSDSEAVVVAKVNAAGIMTGTDKGFEPSKSLTRAEAAAIIVRMKGISESAVKTAAGTTLFNDVAASHWASGYVNQASNLGIVKGVSATEFAPDREVTVAEFVTMAIRALGAGQLVDAEGTWPTNYVNFANEEGILDDVAAIYTATATRMNAATIVANVLESDTWVKDQVDTTGKITYKKSGKTILKDTLNIDFQKDMTVAAVNTKDRYLSLETEVTVDSKSVSVFSLKDAKDYTSVADISSYDVVEGVNLASIKSGDEVDVWFNTKNKEVLGVWAAENSKQSKVEFTEIVKVDDNKITLKVDGKEKKYTVATGATYSLNDVTATQKVDATHDMESIIGSSIELANVYGKVTVVSGDIAAIYANIYEQFGMVKSIRSDKVTAYEKAADVVGSNATYKFNFDEDFDDVEYAITKNGKEVKSLEEGDVVAFYGNDTAPDDVTKYYVEVLTDKVEGKVTAKSGSYIKIDGKKYDLRKGLTLGTAVKTDDEIAAYLINGKVALVEIVEEDDNSDYAVITYYREKAKVYDTDTTATYIVKLTNMDGSETEAMEINLKKTYDKLINGSDDDKEVKAAAKLSTAVLGKMVRYEISSGKVILTELNSDSYGDAEIDAIPSSSKVNQDANKIGSFRVDKDTVIYVLDDGEEDYEKSIKSVKFEDLKDNEVVTGFYADLDDSNNHVGYFLLDDTTKRATSDANFGIVKSIADTSDDDEMEIELLTADGLITVVAEDDRKDDLFCGAFIKYDNGDVITDIELIGDTGTNIACVNEVAFINFNDGSARLIYNEIDDTDNVVDVVDLDENVIYATVDTLGVPTKAAAWSGLKGTSSTPDTFDYGTEDGEYDEYDDAVVADADACLIFTIKDSKTDVVRIAAIVRAK